MKIVTELSNSNFNYICHSLAQKKIPYISISHFKEDYQKRQSYILENNGKPVAMCSLVWSEKHQNFAIKRLICFKKVNAGKGYANYLLTFISKLGKAPSAVLPGWIIFPPGTSWKRMASISNTYSPSTGVFMRKWYNLPFSFYFHCEIFNEPVS